MSNKCIEIKNNATAFIDGEISSLKRDEITTHIKDCPKCLEFITYEKSVKSLLKSPATLKKAPQSLKSKIFNRINEKENKKERPGIFSNFSHFSFFKPALAFASILIVMFVFSTDSRSSTLKALVSQHKKCMSESFNHYRFRNESKFNLNVEKMLNIKPVSMTHLSSEFEFLMGDICKLKGCTASHMVLKNKGKIISFFQTKEEFLDKEGDNAFNIKGIKIKHGMVDGFDYVAWNIDSVNFLIVGKFEKTSKNAIIKNMVSGILKI